MGANKKVYGWYAADKKWLPIKVSMGGSIIISKIPDHAEKHQNGGTDEIIVTGLSGLLADCQIPCDHHESHEDGGIDEIDISGLGTPIRARAYLSENQLNLITGNWTKVLLDTESYDTGDNFANYKFTTPVSGYYLTIGTLKFTSVVENKPYSMGIFKNGAIIEEHFTYTPSNYDLSLAVFDLIYLDVDDYLELYAVCWVDVNTVDIASGAVSTYLIVNLLQV